MSQTLNDLREERCKKFEEQLRKIHPEFFKHEQPEPKEEVKKEEPVEKVVPEVKKEEPKQEVPKKKK